MNNFIQKNRQLIIGVLIGVVSIYFISSIIVEKRLANLQNFTEVKIETSNNELLSLAEAIARGEANGVASKTVSDCTITEQAQFDNRLSRLDAGLTNIELKELDILFSRCAPVQVIRRSAMVVQLESEVQKLNLLLEQRKLLGEYDQFEVKAKNWEDLLNKEKKITDLSFNLVSLQYEIIQQLISGLKVDSATANELKVKGQAIRMELDNLMSEVNLLREGLK